MDFDPGSDTLRVLVASHSHPRVLNGGSEVASFSLFERLREEPDVKAWYCGCSRGVSFARAGQSITQPFDRDAFIYSVGEFDWFRFANRDMNFARDFRAMLGNLRPDVVHFHHYINFGMEAFRHVREVLPNAAIILTLHEFLAICNQQGQMVKRFGGKLCRRSGNVECARCFPEVTPADFFLRASFIRHFLGFVDHFIAPSAFLARRYVEWGLPENRISVVENVPAARSDDTTFGIRPAPERDGGTRSDLRVGFFGQISALKGMNVLLDAAAILEAEGRHDISFSIFGDHTAQPEAYQAEFLRRIDEAGVNVLFNGAYHNEDVDELMGTVDLVLVPSIWWENSPVVIQEAFRNGRPVVCSNIGGMAEKVRDGIDGRHFQAASPRALATLLRTLADDPAQMDVLRAGATEHAAQGNNSYEQHLALYRAVRASRLRGGEQAAVLA
jgi:glycosyltransferase involved in cell wall biosynthesis